MSDRQALRDLSNSALSKKDRGWCSKGSLPAALRIRLISTAEQLRQCDLERERLRGERALLIREALLANVTEREIAQAAGVTGPRVHQLKEEILG